MIALLAPSGLAIALALALGGSLEGWQRAHVRWWPAAAGAFGLELLLYSWPIDEQPWALQAGPELWIAARIVLLAVLVRNAAAPGVTRSAWLLAALGVGLNTLVITLNNDHMPQSPAAAAVVWGPERAGLMVPPGKLDNVSTLDDTTRLAWLADEIPEPAWLPRPNVVSVGDLLLAAGMAVWAFRITRP